MQCVRARPGAALAGFGRPVLAALPVAGATHYQLHSGLYREAFEAEREAFSSSVRRLLAGPALRLNRFRSALLRAERLLLSSADVRLMVFSDGLRHRLESGHGVAADRIAVERPGVDRGLFRPEAEPGKRSPGAAFRLLFVGNNFELKGLRTVLSALAMLGNRLDASLTVAGGGPEARYRRLAARLGIGGRVAFAGALAPATVAELYRRHDALVHPSFYDPFPLVVVEALASGLPVVTTRRTGASEVLPPDAGLLLDDPADAAALAAALFRLSDAAVYGAMAAAAGRTGSGFDSRIHFGRVRRWLGLGP